MHITSWDFQRKMHGRTLTESIRFKVTSRINVSRVKKKLGSIFEVSACGMDVAVVKTGDMKWEVKVVKNYVGKHDIVKL